MLPSLDVPYGDSAIVACSREVKPIGRVGKCTYLGGELINNGSKICLLTYAVSMVRQWIMYFVSASDGPYNRCVVLRPYV
jgi:hypothetical protein